MFNLIPNQAKGRVKGLFNAGYGTLSIDVANNIFEDNKQVEFHEYTHYYLTKFTNFGLVYMILQEILHTKVGHIIVPKVEIEDRARILHNAMYIPQEGLAHLMQARLIFKELGMDGVRDLERKIDNQNTYNNPNIAFSYCRNIVKLEQNLFDEFTQKMPNLSLGTGLISDIITCPELLTDLDKFQSYIANENNSPEKRFIRLCSAIERDNNLLYKSEEEIAASIKLKYWINRTNLAQAQVINIISEKYTDVPANAKEEDISSLSGDEVFMPAIEKMIFRDTNIERDAHVGVSHSEIELELPYFRTLMFYNTTSLKLYNGEYPFYSFSKKRLIINSTMPFKSSFIDRINHGLISKIIQVDLFDYNKNKIKTPFDELSVNIVWYKTSNDLQLLTDMIVKRQLQGYLSLLKLSDESKYVFYIVKLDECELVHIFFGLPIHYKCISEANLVEINGDDTWEKILRDNQIHFNNFTHDLIGFPEGLNLIEIMRNGDAFGDKLESALKNGQKHYHLCICGSGRKYNKCHGF